MRRIIFLLACLCSLVLIGCAAKRVPSEQATDGNKCEAVAASEQWFKELMKTAAENVSSTTEGSNCPCYETITCEGVKYCSAHKCIDGSIHNPWEKRN